jgi:hypothetical protein
MYMTLTHNIVQVVLMMTISLIQFNAVYVEEARLM